MKKLSLYVLIALLAIAVQPMYADTIGGTVTGALHLGNNASVNYFDPSAGGVPAGAANSSGATVTLGTGISTFSYAQSVVVGHVPVVGTAVMGLDLVTAAFSGDKLVITTTTPVSLGNFEMDFTDTAFAGGVLKDVVETGGFGDTSSLTGDTLKLLIGGGVGVDVYSFQLGASSAPTASSVTPEPGSLALLGTGMVGIMGVMRRRMVA